MNNGGLSKNRPPPTQRQNMYNENILKNFDRIIQRLETDNSKHWQVIATVLEKSCSDEELDQVVALMKLVHTNQHICKMCKVETISEDDKKEQTD